MLADSKSKVSILLIWNRNNPQWSGDAMQFISFEPGIEVNATTVAAIVRGMSSFTSISGRYLSKVNIGRIVDGELILDMDAWYSQDAWLKAFENIAEQIGDKILFNIGKSIPKSAVFPDWATDIASGIKLIDIAYHINHRKNGESLYDMETKTMREGIGHYGCEAVPGKREILSVCKNPYPCVFDRGILTEMATRFEPGAVVIHDDSCECRQNGADSCTYHVRW
ncbi:MAG: hypothetical protein LBQ51_07060 [Desulfovibrio sp.]|nr:hypothetical protein [Desulfovibrio sp.]